MVEQQQIDEYLTELRHHLGSMTLTDREEIVREINAHIRDSAEEPGETVTSILSRLGPADKLAAQYREGLLIHRASQSYSPLVLLRGALRFTRRGLFGIFVAFAGLFGYWLGGGIVLVGLMVLPWLLIQRHTSTASAYPPTPFWVTVVGILVFIAMGCAILLLTTLLMRTALRVFRRWQLPL